MGQMGTQLSAMELPEEERQKAKEIVVAYEDIIDRIGSKPGSVV